MDKDRRHILGILGKGALLLGLGGLETILSSGCAAVSRTNLRSHQASIRSSVSDPHDYLKYLREDEYIIPNEVFNAFVKTVEEKPIAPVGGHLSRNYLDTEEKEKEFIERLQNLNLSNEEISIYQTLFTKPDNIIFKATVLEDGYFEKALPHERFHKELKRLPKKAYGYMRKVARDILSIKREDPVDHGPVTWVREKGDKTCLGHRVMSAKINWEEFYPYLAQGEFKDEVEEKLKTDYPIAYRLFDGIREKTKLRKER
jgi:hypothetical protein